MQELAKKRFESDFPELEFEVRQISDSTGKVVHFSVFEAGDGPAPERKICDFPVSYEQAVEISSLLDTATFQHIMDKVDGEV